MKSALLTLALLFMCSNSFAALNCKGHGLKGDLRILSARTLTMAYADAHSNAKICTFSLDTKYRPRTIAPQYDRYQVEINASSGCDAKFVWVSKDLMSSRVGQVLVEQPYGGEMEALHCLL